MEKPNSSSATTAEKSAVSSSPPQTTSAVGADPILGHKIRILIYDLRNLTRDPYSDKRLNATLDEHYISAPYFTEAEAKKVKNATVDVQLGLHWVPGGCPETIAGKPVEEALCKILENFLENRRGTGDARPCAPHTLAPLYATLFGIGMKEVYDLKFSGRLKGDGT